MAKMKLKIAKYEGDDAYSWAVFCSDGIKDLKNQPVIFYGQAVPIVCGLSRQEALHYKSRLEKSV